MGSDEPDKIAKEVISVDEYVRRTLATAPKYSQATRDKIRDLLSQPQST